MKSIMILITAVTLSNPAPTIEDELRIALGQLSAAKTSNEIMAASASFDKVARKYPNEVMPNYYSAYSRAQASYVEEDAARRDKILDEADKYLKIVNELNPDDDETYVLSALLSNARLQVDGHNRWKKYGDQFDIALDRAKELDPNNPRIYYLMGISNFYKPEAFGGGKQKAKALFEKAEKLYALEDGGMILKPAWGEKSNKEYLKRCDQ